MTKLIANSQSASETLKRRIIGGSAGLLLLIVLVAGYRVVVGLFTDNRLQAEQQAVLQVLPGATQWQSLVYRNGVLQPVAAVQIEDERLYAGYDAAGNFVGYAIPAAGPGYQDTIRLLYGYQPATRLIVGLAVLESDETPGVGDQIQQPDDPFRANFRRLAIDPYIQTVAHGEKTKANEVDAIAGATISSQAVVQILNTANRRWLARLPATGAEPPLWLSKVFTQD